MRTRLAFVAASAAAAAFLPAQPASAVCLPPYQLVLHKCSPCSHVNEIGNDLHDKYGIPPVQTTCLA